MFAAMVAVQVQCTSAQCNMIWLDQYTRYELQRQWMQTMDLMSKNNVWRGVGVVVGQQQLREDSRVSHKLWPHLEHFAGSHEWWMSMVLPNLSLLPSMNMLVVQCRWWRFVLCTTLKGCAAPRRCTHWWRRHWCTQVVQTFWWLTAVTQTDHFPQRSLTLPFLHNNSLFSHPTSRPNLSQSHSQITILTFGFFVKSLWSVLRMHTLYPVVDRKAKNISKKANNIFQSGWQLWCIGWGSIDFTDREDIWKQGSTHLMRGT